MAGVGDILAQYFDHIYLVNLDKDVGRMEKMDKLMSGLGIKYERIVGVYGREVITDAEFKSGLGRNYSQWERMQNPLCRLKNVGAYGCLMSHRKIVQDAREKGYKRILVFEDDIIVHKNIAKLLEHSCEILASANWKLIYLGSTQHSWNGIRAGVGNIYRAHDTDATFAYGMDSAIYDEMLKLTAHPKFPIDFYYRYFQNKYNCPVFYPQLFISRIDESNIRGGRDIRVLSKQFKWNLANYFI